MFLLLFSQTCKSTTTKLLGLNGVSLGSEGYNCPLGRDKENNESDGESSL